MTRSETRGADHYKWDSAPAGRRASLAVMSGTFHCLKLHVVFSTKNREPWLRADLRPRVFDYLGGVIRGERGVVHAIGGVDDHVHLCFGWRTDEAISVLMRKLKANSSGWIHEALPGLRGFAWQEGYAVFSVSQSQLERVCAYVGRQEEHHRVKPFREELAELLRAHQIAFEDRFLD